LYVAFVYDLSEDLEKSEIKEQGLQDYGLDQILKDQKIPGFSQSFIIFLFKR